MLLSNYDIENSFSSKLLGLGISTLGFFSFFKRKLNLKNLRTGLINSLSKRVKDIYVISEGLKQVVLDTDASNNNISEAYPHAKKALEKYKRLYSSVEKRNFFGQKEMQDLSESTLANFYKIESHLRQIAYSDMNVPEDKELTEFASTLSISNH